MIPVIKLETVIGYDVLILRFEMERKFESDKTATGANRGSLLSVLIKNNLKNLILCHH